VIGHLILNNSFLLAYSFLFDKVLTKLMHSLLSNIYPCAHLN